MSRNNDQRDAGITQDEVLDVLIASGRPNFNKRLLTYFSSRAIGLLPELRRSSRLGSNAPVYVWDEDILEQIIELYGLVERGCRDYQSRLLYLWLHGYEVPFEPILKLWLRPTESAFHALIEGAEDTDAVLDRVSTFIFEHWLPKWRYSPRPHPIIQKIGIDNYQIWVEAMLDMFLVPGYVPDESFFASSLDISQRMEGTLETNQQGYADSRPRVEETQALLGMLREILSLPQLRDVLLNATDEEWARAREDYQMLCSWLHTLLEVLPPESLSLFTDPEMQSLHDRLFLIGGLFLVPAVLSARHYGYSYWIDQSITWVNEQLSQLSNLEVGEQLSQQLTTYNRHQQEQKQGR